MVYSIIFRYIVLLLEKDSGYFMERINTQQKKSERILRLPLYYGLNEDQVKMVTDSIYEYFKL